jgi:ubiquinone/menaquinone biosynthesis C-methylase UbiE
MTLWHVDQPWPEPGESAVFSTLLSSLYDQSWYGKLLDAEVAFYLQYVREGFVLELGAGTGRLSVPLFRAGCDLYGIEGSSAMLARLHEKLPPSEQYRFIHWNAQHTPYPIQAASVDHVIIPFSTFGLMHNQVADLGANCMLHELTRLLKPGGKVILNDFRTTPLDRTQVDQAPWVAQFDHFHAVEGPIREEQISQFRIVPNRLCAQQMIRERVTRFIRLRDSKVLETHVECIPLWGRDEFPKLGQDAGLTYLGGILVPDFHDEPSMMHLYQKPVTQFPLSTPVL